MVQVGLFHMSLTTSAALAGVVFIGAYVIFGGPADIRKRRRKKDYIPGLANIGNSCFLNALVQSLASCPLFITWLSTKYSDSSPPLVSALLNLLKVLNNERSLGGNACAGEVLSALRGHGWVISSEEQDTHELFHVLTATIDDELMNATSVPSLLDVSWIDINCMNSLKDGVVLKANVWEQTVGGISVKGKKCGIKKKIFMKNNANMVKERNNIFSKVNGFLVEGRCDESHMASVSGTETLSECNSGQIMRGSSAEIDSDNQICDNKGCEDSFIVKSHQDCEAQQSKEQLVSINGDTLYIEKTFDSTSVCDDIDYGNSKEHRSNGEVAKNMFSDCDDNGNDRDIAYGNKASKKSYTGAALTKTQGTENSYWKIHSDQPDSPFRGYLASQLQCTLCGHKNPAQWTSFESLSLSLPSFPWEEVTLQELLDSYITQEKVTDVTCDGCTKKAGSNVKTIFTKQLTIGKLPDCLCFHIKRTVWLENGSAVKRRDHLIFPEFLIMDPYTYTTSINSQNCRVIEQDGNTAMNSTYWSENGYQCPLSSILSQNATSSHLEPSPFVHVTRVRYENLYRLKAVIVHVGDVFCGHFVTYRRGPVGSRTRNRWFYTSDLLVREASLEEVRKANAYMILYEKVT